MTKKYVRASALGFSVIALVLLFLFFFFFRTETNQSSNIKHKSVEGESTTKNVLSHKLGPAGFESIDPPVSAVNNELIEIEIGDTNVSFRAYLLELNEFSLPVEKGGAYLYDRLSQRGEGGDIIAARMLSVLLSRCGETFINREEHDNALALLKNEGKYPSANPSYSAIKVQDEMLDSVASFFENEYELCKELSRDKRSEANKWARLAAEGGDFLAIEQLLNSSDISSGEKIDLIEKRWKEFGYVDSTTELAAILSGLSSFPGFADDVEADPKQAYAYFLVSTRINAAVLEETNPIEARQKEADSYAFEQILTSKLTPQEHLDAEKLAVDLIESNDTCCSFDPRQAYKISTK